LPDDAEVQRLREYPSIIFAKPKESKKKVSPRWSPANKSRQA
jgi:hypothetical protein